MNDWKLVPEAIDEYAKPDVWNSAYAAGWNDCRKRMLAAAPAPDVQPVAWMNKYPDGHREFHNGKDNAADYAVPVYAQPTDVADLVKALREVTDGIEHGFTDRKADVVIANAYAVLTKWEGK
jgi:hypothetical protein